MKDRVARLAVLIDAENASDKIATRLFEEIARIGDASVRRIYGDFSSPQLRGWTDALPKYGIIPHQQFAYTIGKNASDIALVIDAMDLLHGGGIDGFCLVSSDSDFTRLALRIREQGVDVFGFGRKNTPESFRQACHRFVYTESMLPPSAPKASATPQAATVNAPIKATRLQKAVAAKVPQQPKPQKAPQSQPVKKPQGAVKVLVEAVKKLEAKDGWVPLSGLGTHLSKSTPDFNPRSFGFRRLSDLVVATEKFVVEKMSSGSMRIRAR